MSESTCSEGDGPPIVNPPTTYNRSSCDMNEHEHSGTDMLGRAVHVFTAGSYISAWLKGFPSLPDNNKWFHYYYYLFFTLGSIDPEG